MECEFLSAVIVISAGALMFMVLLSRQIAENTRLRIEVARIKEKDRLLKDLRKFRDRREGKRVDNDNQPPPPEPPPVRMFVGAKQVRPEDRDQ